MFIRFAVILIIILTVTGECNDNPPPDVTRTSTLCPSDGGTTLFAFHVLRLGTEQLIVQRISVARLVAQ